MLFSGELFSTDYLDAQSCPDVEDVEEEIEENEEDQPIWELVNPEPFPAYIQDMYSELSQDPRDSSTLDSAASSTGHSELSAEPCGSGTDLGSVESDSGQPNPVMGTASFSGHSELSPEPCGSGTDSGSVESASGQPNPMIGTASFSGHSELTAETCGSGTDSGSVESASGQPNPMMGTASFSGHSELSPEPCGSGTDSGSVESASGQPNPVMGTASSSGHSELSPEPCGSGTDSGSVERASSKQIPVMGTASTSGHIDLSPERTYSASVESASGPGSRTSSSASSSIVFDPDISEIADFHSSFDPSKETIDLKEKDLKIDNFINALVDLDTGLYQTSITWDQENILINSFNSLHPNDKVPFIPKKLFKMKKNVLRLPTLSRSEDIIAQGCLSSKQQAILNQSQVAVDISKNEVLAKLCRALVTKYHRGQYDKVTRAGRILKAYNQLRNKIETSLFTKKTIYTYTAMYQ